MNLNCMRCTHFRVKILIWCQIVIQALVPLGIAFSVRANLEESASQVQDIPFTNMLSSTAEGLATGSSDSMKTIGTSMATVAASSSAEQWLNQFGTAKVQLSMDSDGSWGQSSVDLFTTLFESEKSLWFTQLGLRAPNSRITANVGGGYRTYYIDNWMLGGNVFVDKDFTGQNQRIGFGSEAWTNYLKFSANEYMGISGWQDSRDFNGYVEKSSDGFDLQAEGYLPAYPQAGAKLLYEKYYGSKVALFNTDSLQKNPSAITLGINYSPIPLISFEASYRKGQDSMDDTAVKASIHYEFGRNWRFQIEPDNVRSMRTLAGSRHDLVERNNQIIMQYHKKSDSDIAKLSLQSIADNASADGQMQNALQVRATNSGNLPIRNALVTWSTTGSARFLSPTAVTNDEGLATAYLTDTRSEVVQVTAKSGSAAASQSSHFTITTASHISLVLTKDNSAADGLAANSGLATITDVNNKPIANSRVSWSVSAPAMLQHAELTTDAKGQVRTSFTSLTAGEVNLKINVGDVSEDQVAHFIANSDKAQITDFAVTTDNRPADGVTPDNAIVTVKDPAGNPVGSLNVELSTDKETVLFFPSFEHSITMQTNLHGQLIVPFTDTVAEMTTLYAKLENGNSKTAIAKFSTNTAALKIKNLVITKDMSVANGVASNTAEVQVVDGNENSVSGVPMSWSADKPTVKFGAATNTDAAGKSIVSFTDTLAETVSVKATLSNGNTKAVASEFTADSTTAQLQHLLVTKDGSLADGVMENTAEVYVVDAQGNALAGRRVFWHVDKKGVALSPGGKTDLSGKTTVSYTSTTAQNFQLIATLQNGNTASASSLFIANSATERISALDVTTGAVADGIATNAATVLVTDANNNPVADVPVTWKVDGSAILSHTSGTTDSAGKMSITLSNDKAENVNVSVSLSSGANQTKSMNFIANSTTAIIGTFTVTTGAIANGVATNTGNINVVDANKNPVGGVTVSWAVSGHGIISDKMSVTDNNGNATIAVTDERAENITLTAKLPNESQSQQMVFLSDNTTARINKLEVTNGAVANGIAKNTGTVFIVDAKGNPVSGSLISWSVTGNASLSGEISKTDGDGQATVTLSDLVSESVSLTASLNSESKSQTVEFVADPTTAVISELSVPVNEALANNVDTDTVAVKIMDAHGNLLSGEDVAWTSSNPDVVIPKTSTTDSSGVSAVNVTSPVSGVFSITAHLANGKSGTVQTTFVIAAQILTENIALTRDYAAADNHDKNSIRVKVTDGHNNPSSGQKVHFSATNDAVFDTNNIVTGLDGIAITTAHSPSIGVSSVTASLDNGSSASVDMHFDKNYMTMESIDVGGISFDTLSGFPSTGFQDASFSLNVGHGKANTDFDWTTSAGWVTAGASGNISFTGQGTPETVSIYASPKSGEGAVYRYQITLKSWFVFYSAYGSRADAEKKCSENGMALPRVNEMTNAPTVRSNGTRVPNGPLWSEWGTINAANVSSSQMNFAAEYTESVSYIVRLTTGWAYDGDPDQSSRPACVRHF